MQLLLLMVPFGAADPPVEGRYAYPPIERGGLTARLTVQVADADEDFTVPTVILTLTMQGPPGLEVESRLDDSTASWKAVVASSWTARDAGAQWQVTYRLLQQKSGPAPVPAVKALARSSPDAPWQEFTWVDILKDLQPVPGPTPTAPPTAERGRPILLAGAVALVALLLATVSWLRRRPPTFAPPTPEETAFRAFDAIEASVTRGGDAVRTLQERLAEVLRVYLAEHCSTPATRQTTAEFLAALAGRLPADRHEQLRQLLAQCDLAKFAGTEADAATFQRQIAAARALVAETAADTF